MTSRPTSVTLAAGLQVLIAVAFLTIPLIGAFYGADVQAAAEAEVARQGLPPRCWPTTAFGLTRGCRDGASGRRGRVRHRSRRAQLAGKRIGRILQPLVLLGNLAIMASQRTAVQVVESRFDSSGDAALQRIDVQALFDAAFGVYPAWLPSVVNVRNVVVIIGSLLVIALLAAPTARAYFRRGRAVGAAIDGGPSLLS